MHRVQNPYREGDAFVFNVNCMKILFTKNF